LKGWLNGKPVRLRFELRDADLLRFRFEASLLHLQVIVHVHQEWEGIIAFAAGRHFRDLRFPRESAQFSRPRPRPGSRRGFVRKPVNLALAE
jgi:hypothetical protein